MIHAKVRVGGKMTHSQSTNVERKERRVGALHPKTQNIVGYHIAHTDYN